MNKSVITWAGGILVMASLCGFIGASAIRLDRMESETQKVSTIERRVQIITLYLKIQDPALYIKAERLAN